MNRNFFQSLLVFAIIFVMGCAPDPKKEPNGRFINISYECGNGCGWSVLYTNEECRIKWFYFSTSEVIKRNQILPGDRFKIVKTVENKKAVYTMAALPEDNMSRCDAKVESPATPPTPPTTSTPTVSEPIFKQATTP